MGAGGTATGGTGPDGGGRPGLKPAPPDADATSRHPSESPVRSRAVAGRRSMATCTPRKVRLSWKPTEFSIIFRMTILVTGATGKTGRHVVRELLSSKKEVRILTRRPDEVRPPSGVTVVQGDLTAPESLSKALDGVERAFLFPVLHAIPEFAQAARRAGVRRVVLFTGAWAAGHTERDRGSWVYPRYRAAEAALSDSGLAEWTVLRPAPFATNALWWAPAIRADGVVRLPHPEAVCPVIHEADLAAAVTRTLLDDGHHGAHYTLTGPAHISQAEQVAAIGEAIGRPLRIERIPAEQWRTEAERFLRPGIVSDLLREWSDTERDPSTALPVLPTVAELTGRPARTFAQWAGDHTHDFA
ncbi:SDR family oxidoreductase [Streptomyces sp. NPDC051041]|uniref:SDR family oxidoreductase n=1 Tax=Streptomyces sp. NPDC051041 TaxID=3365640 RepID=UPI0037B9BD69